MYRVLYKASLLMFGGIMLAMWLSPAVGLLPFELAQRIGTATLLMFGVILLAGFPETWVGQGFASVDHARLVSLCAGLSALAFLGLLIPTMRQVALVVLFIFMSIGVRGLIPLLRRMWGKPTSAF